VKKESLLWAQREALIYGEIPRMEEKENLLFKVYEGILFLRNDVPRREL